MYCDAGIGLFEAGPGEHGGGQWSDGHGGRYVHGERFDLDRRADDLGLRHCDRDRATCPPGLDCTFTGDSVVNLCFPYCDPLSQDCPGDDLCIPDGESFSCALDASGEAGLYGDPCEYANACKPGLYCLDSEHVEGCQAAACCTPFCDTSRPLMCPGATQECIPWYEEGMAPPGFEIVGICGVPQ